MAEDPTKKHLYKPEEIPEIKKNKIALLCVDLQYACGAPGYGTCSSVDKEGWEKTEFAYYFNRLKNIVLPNVKNLQTKFRNNQMEVIHLHIESLTNDGRDRSLEHKKLGIFNKPGSKEAQILPEVKPIDDEINISKTASGAFNCTNLEYILRNLNIEQLVVVGVVTNECVESTVRAAADKSFTVFVPEDCTATMDHEIHNSAIKAMSHTYAHIVDTETLINRI